MSWYKMHRGWQKNDFFADEKYTEREAWEWLIANAAFADVVVNIKGSPIKLTRGQITHSIRFLAEAWQWNKAKTERFLKRLEKWDMVSIKSETGQIIITICEYSKYQGDCDSSETETRQQRGQDRDRTETDNKNLRTKELKKEGEGVSNDTAPPKIKIRGSRLSADWELPEEWGQWAITQGLSFERILTEEEKFRDYWHARAGPDAVKLDWQATWRNWIRRANE